MRSFPVTPVPICRQLPMSSAVQERETSGRRRCRRKRSHSALGILAFSCALLANAPNALADEVVSNPSTPTLEGAIPTSVPTFSPTSRPTSSMMPSLSAQPSAFPTLSMMPSDAPSISHMPTVTFSPSFSPSVSKQPSVAPVTRAPIRSPLIPVTRAPTRAPTRRPTVAPTLPPTRPPTPPPTRAPTMAPTRAPTRAPTLAPTRAPTRMPTSVPTSTPTDSPTSIPTDLPSAIPSELPSVGPSARPSDGPSMLPTQSMEPTPVTHEPTASSMPTREPSAFPSNIPTITPSNTPSAVPTLNPTSSPTDVPSAMPSLELRSSDHEMKMLLRTTAGELRGRQLIDYETATQAHILGHIRRNLTDASVGVTANVASQEFIVVRSGASRRLQEVVDTYLEMGVTILIDYRSQTDYDTAGFIKNAFSSAEDRAAYIESLKRQNNAAFGSLESVELSVDGREAPIIDNPVTPPDESGFPLGMVIGGSVGGIVLIAMAALGAHYGLKRKKPKQDDDERVATKTATSSGTPLRVSTEILVGREDDISTLGDPVGGMTYQGSARDERTASVADDYDYAKEYLLGQQQDYGSGSLDEDDKLTATDSAGLASGKTSGTFTRTGPIGASVFSDDSSFEKQFNGEYGAIDQRFEIDVPPGKLGMVIDTPNGGVPMVHAIKAESILANRVQVGDRLVQVDEEDVTTLTAVQVSKLISVRSNKQRVLVFMRSVGGSSRFRMDSL